MTRVTLGGISLPRCEEPKKVERIVSHHFALLNKFIQNIIRLFLDAGRLFEKVKLGLADEEKCTF